jgi:hypothetical protein
MTACSAKRAFAFSSSAQQHGRHRGHRVGFEQVGRHAGAVADVVADVVGDHRGVARVILGNAGFHLAHQVGADVGALGEDAAAKSGEDRNQGGTETEADQRMDDVFHLRARAAQHFQHRVVAGDAQQAEANHQHAGDGAALEGDIERLVEADPLPLRRCARWREPKRSCRCSRQHPTSTAPMTKPTAVLVPRNIQINTASTTPTMPIVVYWRFR